VKHFKEALKISNYDRAVVLAYGEMLMSNKKYAESKEVFEGDLKTNPNHAEILSLIEKSTDILGKVTKLGHVVDKIK
jgi:predicted Zn-dependent protease